jgi:hypothetical protein
MKNFLAGCMLLLTSFQLKAIPNFPCDSIRVDSVVVNQPSQYLQVYMFNISTQTFTTPHLHGILAANSYITLSTQDAISSLFDRFNGPNGGVTQFHVNGTIPAASSVPTGTVFTGTVTLTNPSNSAVTCDYVISFTYGTGPVGIENFSAENFQLHCFPNPATNEILLGENSLNENNIFFIYDCEGKLMLTTPSNQINISDFPAGIYFFREEEKAGKFIKL